MLVGKRDEQRPLCVWRGEIARRRSVRDATGLPLTIKSNVLRVFIKNSLTTALNFPSNYGQHLGRRDFHPLRGLCGVCVETVPTITSE